MKSSIYRKRYILIKGNVDYRHLSGYGVKVKFNDNNYTIVLANQFNKDLIIRLLRKSGHDVIYVSGTIKKCKKIMSLQSKFA
ncbi:hypothetical protein [Picrophilus oshimae]|uniref:Uncharacterized protein n=1 Tax=Picrophilus torridus (strain ATCC 700027 / DSM 9790 / JCM 10055 / NBRC 100828 / KAW 2/3) TaxID=1122961 RepID=A0A8G2FVI6_PICTO|nr:hypothetical protein [Picrophilus oshimae]SMD30234.1 hypothetical protein SAMN02745355_0101 [Picrophilus oshimae DSM 9789]